MKEAYRGPFTPDQLNNGKPVDLSLGEEAKGFVRKNAEGNPTWEHQELADQLYQWTDIFRDRLIDEELGEPMTVLVDRAIGEYIERYQSRPDEGNQTIANHH